MAATNDSGEGHGTNGSPQEDIEETLYPSQEELNESEESGGKPPIYVPSPKHDKGGWGSDNPIKSEEEGQKLLDSGYKDGKQIYNITAEGKIVKFQPDNTPENGYHSYEVSKPKDVPTDILKQMLADGKISKVEYNKFRKGKK